jgi:hypothetical protein
MLAFNEEGTYKSDKIFRFLSESISRFLSKS